MYISGHQWQQHRSLSPLKVNSLKNRGSRGERARSPPGVGTITNGAICRHDHYSSTLARQGWRRISSMLFATYDLTPFNPNDNDYCHHLYGVWMRLCSRTTGHAVAICPLDRRACSRNIFARLHHCSPLWAPSLSLSLSLHRVCFLMSTFSRWLISCRESHTTKSLSLSRDLLILDASLIPFFDDILELLWSLEKNLRWRFRMLIYEISRIIWKF